MSLLSRLKPTTSYIVQLRQQADLSAVRALPRGADRRVAAWNALVETASRTQPAFNAQLDALKGAGLVRSYGSVPLGNSYEISVPAGKAQQFEAALQATGAAGLVLRAELKGGGGREPGEGIVAPKPPTPPVSPQPPADPRTVPARAPRAPAPPVMADGTGWHVTRLAARSAWQAGADGSGVTVGIVDTGLDWQHPAVARAYRGADGKHDFNWFDFEGGKRAPVDAEAHGTHVGGIVAGQQAGWATGIAPGVKLIAARGGGTAGVGALQWMLAPTDLKGENPNPRLGADVVNNSWGLPAEWAHMGALYETPLRQLEDAGMLMVFAAGNDGPGPDTVLAPGSSRHVLSVGSTTRVDKASDFSSRGKRDATGTQPDDRPDVVAPGSGVPSSIPRRGVFGEMALMNLINIVTGGLIPGLNEYGRVPGARNGNYWTLSGTSMASPVVTGAAALLLSKHPNLGPDDIKRILRASARDLGRQGWDPTYGAGLIDINAALKLLTASEPPAST